MTSSGHRDHRRYDAYARNHEDFGDSELIPAATVVVLRDAETGLEALMLRRNSKIAFGGMWVFPGGRVDEEDANKLQVELEREIPLVVVGANIYQYAGFARMCIEYAAASIQRQRPIDVLEFHLLLARN